MELSEVIKRLHKYQKWRRGRFPFESLGMTAKELGETLDEAIRILRKVKKNDYPRV